MKRAAYTPPPLCPARKVRRYPSWPAALSILLVETRRSGLALRIYVCPACQGYHLTRQARPRTETAGDSGC